MVYRSVDLVYSRLSFKQYARKQFMRKRTFRDDQDLLKRFAREITSLKRLSHHHLVSVIGSYTDQKSVAYLMEPVGECNLMTYLQQPRHWIEERLPSLRKYFGCLANAVAYLHRQRVRHRDLKPQNILVKNYVVYIADFGNALDWSKRGRDTTNDSTIPFTEQYVAPEVAKRSASSRNSASDIWSLGTVFLDMITVLRGSSIRALRAFLETHGTRHPCAWGNSQATNQWFEEIRKIGVGPESDNEPLVWIKDMTQSSPNNRPSSGGLTSQIRSTTAPGHFIGHCCATDDDAEDYPSPPASSYSEEDADIYLDDMPPDLDLGGKPFGSILEPSRQSKIERWLSVSSAQDPFVSDESSELPDVLRGDIDDVPYDIVEDDANTMIPIQEPSGSPEATTQRLITLDSCAGYDIVEDDSDNEKEAEHGALGYEVTEDSSESEATVRLELNTMEVKSSGIDDYESGFAAASNPSDHWGERLSSNAIQAIQLRLDALAEDPVERQFQSPKPDAPSAAASDKSTSETIEDHDVREIPRPIRRDKSRSSAPASSFQMHSNIPEKPLTSPNLTSLRAARPAEVVTATAETPKAANVKPRKTRRDVLSSPQVETQLRSQGITSKTPLEGSKPESLNAANLAKLMGVMPENREAVRPHTSQASRKPSKVKRGMTSISADEPQISPSVYMQEVWEAASSATTSVMSERTKKVLGGFGSGIAWQDRTAHFLEKYVKAGKAAAVRELLKAGCNPGTKKEPRIRPLMLAVKGGSQRHNKCVAALLNYGADVNARENSGKTALHHAIEHQNFPGYTSLIRDLLEAGADPNNKDKSGDFPLLQILYGGSEPLEKHKRDALACLLREEFAADVNVVPPGTRNMPLHLAVRRKDPWAVSMLLTRGALVNEPNGSGMTPLMLAANAWSLKMSSRQNQVLKFLLDAGVKVNERYCGTTALHHAASNLCERAVSLLLDKGADASIKDSEGHEPSFHAGHPPSKVRKTPEAHAAIMMMLFDAMGHGSLEAVDGECAVVTAVRESRIEDAESVFSHGADVSLLYESISKEPLLHIALSKQNLSMAQLLVDRGALLEAEDIEDRQREDACMSLNPVDFTNLVVQDVKTKGKRFKLKSKGGARL